MAEIDDLKDRLSRLEAALLYTQTEAFNQLRHDVRCHEVSRILGMTGATGDHMLGMVPHYEVTERDAGQLRESGLEYSSIFNGNYRIFGTSGEDVGEVAPERGRAIEMGERPADDDDEDMPF